MEKIKINKLVFGGQGLGETPTGKKAFVWNALPGELVEVEFTKKKRGYVEAVAENIIDPSKDRIDPKEDHFLSCSPWQIMTSSAENSWKEKIAAETFEKIANLSLNWEIKSIENQSYGYRNKMEFSFWWDNDTNKISLSLFKRGSKGKYPLDGCLLASPAINKIGDNLVKWLNNEAVEARKLKTVIIRSNIKGEVIAGLFIKEDINFTSYPELQDGLIGLTIFYSEPKSPASVPTKILWHIGAEYLTEKISDKAFQYGLLSFFQVNLPVFDLAVSDIRSGMENESGTLVDFYSGVGSIGISVGSDFEKCLLIENNAEAVSFAQKNIEINKLSQFKAILSPSEKMLDEIKSDRVIIFDPPRAGLHDKIIERILIQKPKKIVYLSCNLSTQARDVGLLKDRYKITLNKLYNFFPRTPHFEGLIILNLIDGKN